MKDNNESKSADMERKQQAQQRSPTEGERKGSTQGKPGAGRRIAGEGRESDESASPQDEQPRAGEIQGEQERRSRFRNPDHPSRPDEAMRNE